jgi:predicted ATPase
LIESDPQWQELASIWLRELALLVPEINEVANTASTTTPTSDEPDENQQGRLFQAFFHLFANQSKKNNMVLVVEDIQWADSASLQSFHYLARHITRLPIILIFTLRDENLSTDAGLVALLHSLERDPQTTSLSLSRLTIKDTTSFITQILDSAAYTDQISDWLQQETDGNPFFLISLLQSLREEGLLKESEPKLLSELAGVSSNRSKSCIA